MYLRILWQGSIRVVLLSQTSISPSRMQRCLALQTCASKTDAASQDTVYTSVVGTDFSMLEKSFTKLMPCRGQCGSDNIRHRICIPRLSVLNTPLHLATML